ncbi:MAG TPA: hypothetical protein VHE55_02445 [Fimbriimonadaceae bacterium]|nr:hypothetical protein [Fimbriimonadaceae bacterium]
MAIRTTAAKLRAAVAPAVEIGQPILGNVKYIDYENDEIDWGNTLNPLFHKRREFSHEREARLVMMRPTLRNDFVRDAGEMGFSVAIPLADLVEEVVVAPNLAWFSESLESLCRDRGLPFPIRPSALAASPYRLYEEVNIRAFVPKGLVGKVHVPRKVFVVANEPVPDAPLGPDGSAP